MCALRPIYQFDVTKERLDKALKIIEYCRGNPAKNIPPKLTQEQIFEVFMELGFGDAVTFDPQGPMRLELSDLQLLGAAYAMLSVVEAGVKRVINPDFQEAS